MPPDDIAYLAVRKGKVGTTSGELLGILSTRRSGIGLAAAVVNIVIRKVGNGNWWFDDLTKIEFETYREFGIREF